MPPETTLAPAQEELRQFLRQGSAVARQCHKREWPYHSMYELVLAAGIPMPGQLAPRPLRGTIKQCFHNACLIATRYPEQFIYCEGYAVGHIPVHHSWICDHQGTAYELTWDFVGHSYWGIPFDPAYTRRYWFPKGQEDDFLVTLIDRWQEGWPLVSGQNPIEEAVHPNFRKEHYDVRPELDAAALRPFPT